MDGGLDDEWEDATFIAELIRTADEAVASRNPNPTPTPTPAPAPIPTYGPFAATPVSYLPASSASYLPAASHPSPPLHFSPPRELSQRPPLPPPTVAASARDARGFSPPRELSQRQAPEEGSLAIVAASGSAGDHCFVGTGVGVKRDREARELERLKVISFSVFGAEWRFTWRRCICVLFLMLLILTTAEGAEPCLEANE